jgi:electron transfer flavoprotein beta subunit
LSSRAKPGIRGANWCRRFLLASLLGLTTVLDVQTSGESNSAEVDVEILVCARRVPDTSENEIELNRAGNDIERDELVYSINEPDNYAVEEALRITARVGGNVTVVTVGGEDDEEILRREMAMGVQKAGLISDDAFAGSDGRGIATILKAYVEKAHYDLILTGVQADDGAAQVGGMLAAMLDYPFASLVDSIEVLDGNKLKIGREIAGGNKEMSEISLPCVLSIQTGINEPRYVGMRGIRQVASIPIPTFDASELGIDPGSIGDSAAKVKRIDYFMPALGKGAEMLEGSREDNVEKVAELVAAKGGWK